MNKCEFPKNSGKNIAAAGSLWMSGYDSQSLLRTSAQTYVAEGTDFWPGPIDASGTPVSYAVSQDWAKIWKLNRYELNIFLNIANHTISNTPVSILEWPAKGNPYAKGNNNVSLTINTDMAPFVDVNSDGVYNPLQGDYPVMKGDQMLWQIFNDNGATHSGSNGMAVMAEIKCMVYAYGRGTVADDMLFYEYEITNYDASDLDSFVLGMFADLDVGYSFDDQGGFDSSRNLGIMYNGNLYDGALSNGDSTIYRDTIPKAAIKVLRMPGDSCGVTSPAGSFITFSNGNDGIIGDPKSAVHFDNYLRSRLLNGTHLTDTNGNYRKYYMPDDPSVPNGWSACAKGFPPYDRRIVLASEPFTFKSGQTIKYAFALIASKPQYQNGCPLTSFADIRAVADTAQHIFCNPLPVLTSVQSVTQNSKLIIYPNPVSDHIIVGGEIKRADQLKLVDVLGRSFRIIPVRKGNNIEIATAHLPSGTYYLLYSDGHFTRHATFVKD